MGGRRVALLSPCFWPEVRRGSERFVHELAQGLLADGHRPELITSHRGRPSRRVEEGLPVLRLPRPPDGRLRRRMLEDHLTHVPLSAAALMAGGYDVAHAVYPTDALAAAWWGRRTGRPAILSYMGIPDHAGLLMRRRRLEITQRALRDCDAVVALSRYAADAFRAWLGHEVPVIHPGVDLRAFTPGRARAPHPTIVCAASFNEGRKRVGLLIEAFSLVRREHRDARLVLSRPRDLRAVDTLEAVEGVVLADLDDRAALAAAYGEAWVSALPSFGEAFGLVLLEALACGTPVVATDDGGMPEIVDRPEIGRLFAGADPDAAPDELARALLETLELCADPATAPACRRRAEDFSVERTVAKYEQLYETLLDGA